MRAVNFVKRVQWDIAGNVFRHGIAIGDVDNDGDNELVVGTSEGELYIFKGTEVWHKTTGLGFITCVAIGDIFNYGRNALVVICGDGWVHIFYSPRSVNPSTNNATANTTSPTRDPTENSKISEKDFEQFIRLNDTTDHLLGKMECVHLQRIPPNTKVILIADIDCDGANEMILGLTDRVVRSYRWSSNADLGTGKLVGLNKWECANQIGTVTLQHLNDGTASLLVAQPGGTFMRIKCNPDDCGSDYDPDKKNEAAASCVDYQTLGISRMRNPNISTEIIGNLETGTAAEYIAVHELPPKFIAKDDTVELNIHDDSGIDPKNFKSSSMKFRRNRSQPEIRKRSLDESDDITKHDFFPMDEKKKSTKVFSEFSSSEIDQVDGNFVGGNVILGDTASGHNHRKKSILPMYGDFLSKHQMDVDEKGVPTQTKSEENKKNTNTTKNSTQSKPYALATLDGTIMLVKDEIILWAMQVDHQIFALSRLDVTGNGSDEIVMCAWDGQTYILDQQRRSVRFQFEEPVRSFCTGNYSLTSGTSTPSLVYSTFTNKIFLYYDVSLPGFLINGLEPLKFMTSQQKNFVDKVSGNCTGTEKDKKIQQLTEYLLYGMEIGEDDDDESGNEIQ